MRFRLRLVVMVSLLTLAACTGVPEGITPVDNFDLARYTGRWYEIARMDHSFERGLSHVTARYSPRDDGGITVINRGWDTAKGKWKEAEGKAYFVQEETTGHLKVSFFGPFYGSYVIFDLDHRHYQYAAIAGPDRSYLWILSRTPRLNEQTLNELLDLAVHLGYDTSKLVMVDQTPRDTPQPKIP